jgi:hypothetical protein
LLPYFAALLFGIGLVAGAEWLTDEDMVTMMVLLLASGSLGWFMPRLFAISGVAVGLVVPGIAVFSQSTGLHPGYETARQAAAHGPSYAASLLILIGPALLAAFFGRALARLRRTAAL